MAYDIRLKRIYDPVTETDGARVLVDRLWPRGQRKAALKLSRWYKDAAPSSELRRAWHQGGIDEGAFARRYEQPDGRLFTGFIAQSADKIFESTHAGN